MGRKPHEEKRFLKSETIYSSRIKQEIIDHISELHKSKSHFYNEFLDYEFEFFPPINKIIENHLDIIFKQLTNSENIEEARTRLVKIRSQIKPEDQIDVSTMIASRHLTNILDDINFWLAYIYDIESTDRRLEKTIPVLDIHWFPSKIDEITESINSKPERLDIYLSLKREIEKFSRVGKKGGDRFCKFKLHRGKELLVDKGIDYGLLILILDQKIKCNKIRLLLANGDEKSEHNVDGIKDNLTRRFQELEKAGIGFHPFQSFLKSEFVFSKQDVQNVGLPYAIHQRKDLAPHESVLLLTSLQGSLFKTSEIKLMFNKDLFECSKQEFKHWLIGLNMPGTTEAMIDKLLDKPLKKSDKLFMNQFHHLLKDLREF